VRLPAERLLVSRFAGRAAIVTGAAQGIGRAICERLLEEGAAGVVAFDVNDERLADTSAAIADERFVEFVGDVSDSDTVRRSVEECERCFGRLDLMAAHTGIAEPRPLLETDDEHWRRHIAINVDGVFWCCERPRA